MKREHPCFSCVLPDCDDTRPQCRLREAINTYLRLQRARQPIPDDVRQDRAFAWMELYGQKRDAERLEARRRLKGVAA